MIGKVKITYVLMIVLLLIVTLDIMCHLHSNISIRDRCENIMKYQGPTIQKPILPVNCEIGKPCEYPEEVDLRIIVMTYNRDSSLKKLFQSLDKLELDGDTAFLEIWIDRSKTGEVHEKTVNFAESYRWAKGPNRVHIQKAHAGIYGQWIDTWRPKNNTNEVALFLEDDLSVSRYTWRWLKAVHQQYAVDSQCFGYTLQSERLIVANGGSPFRRPSRDTVFMYKLMGSWGFAPVASVWRDFQDWFHDIQKNKSFHPYVPNLIMTSWYKKFEKKHTQDSMWTMWYIYYLNDKNLYCVFNNLKQVVGIKSSLCVHREEPGLHYGGKGRKGAEDLLLTKWSDSYIQFPQKVKKYQFNGKD